ncbi:VanZ family protein [Bradyrhizobium sp. LTSP857]|uniref:VanZ family protein n=1 Tax=Bradyrhizobium sp. LTSP857 TaxID=1619231 RepID=UPI0005D25B2F|nr:VanZ family protein [Bradyrhizobium sp. LTSP857]KJC36484.1 hypothetical protein UP06_32765 [Bradyrhizobium sp. LTSP857]
MEFGGQKLCKLTSWLVLAYVAYVTLSPIKQRPILAGVQFEHFAAFALLGTAFALSYQCRIGFALAIVIGSAFGLEALQLITPDRHGRMIDALAKAAGALCGLGVGQLMILVLRASLARSRKPSQSTETTS